MSKIQLAPASSHTHTILIAPASSHTHTILMNLGDIFIRLEERKCNDIARQIFRRARPQFSGTATIELVTLDWELKEPPTVDLSPNGVLAAREEGVAEFERSNSGVASPDAIMAQLTDNPSFLIRFQKLEITLSRGGKRSKPQWLSGSLSSRFEIVDGRSVVIKPIAISFDSVGDPFADDLLKRYAGPHLLKILSAIGASFKTPGFQWSGLNLNLAGIGILNSGLCVSFFVDDIAGTHEPATNAARESTSDCRLGIGPRALQAAFRQGVAHINEVVNAQDRSETGPFFAEYYARLSLKNPRVWISGVPPSPALGFGFDLTGVCGARAGLSNTPLYAGLGFSVTPVPRCGGTLMPKFAKTDFGTAFGLGTAATEIRSLDI